jgi:ribosomal-protein-alanine N-acetyltransferase
MRKMLVSDSADMYQYASRSDCTKFLSWSPHINQEYTKEYLEYIGSHYSMGDFYDWALIYIPENKMIGTCGFSRFDFANNIGEVGYVINPIYRGRGIAPEALNEVMRFGFERLSLNRIEARYIDGNTASRRVMEKVGMTFEGIHKKYMLVKGEYRDIGICAILKDEYYNQLQERKIQL